MKILRKTIQICLYFSAAFICIFIIFSILFPLPSPKPYSLVIDDRNGKFLHAYLAKDDIWRLRTESDEIPERLKNILIQKEDRFFYNHPGVNPFSIARAFFQNLVTGKRVSGASTITMQVARLLEPKNRTYFNKLIEVFRTLQLELKYSKNEILEMYLSIIPLGGNIEGLKSASIIYYQTPIERLNIAQLFDLILIPNNPNKLRPDRNPERLLEERKNKALRWIKSGLFSREDSIVIWQTDAAAIRNQLSNPAPHFCLRIKQKFSRRVNVHNQESEIRSSLDTKIQKTVETLISNHLRPWKLIGVRNGAVIVIDNRTREILAYVGSEDFNDEAAHGQVDAVKALRSPGSTLKPFLYAILMDQGKLTPKTRLLDIPYDAEGFLAENYDGKYSGLVYADEALRRSLNVPMVRLLNEIGTGAFIDFVSETGISSLQVQKEKLGLSLILGGCGVTLEVLTAAYSAFPNTGNYEPVSFIRKPTPQPKKEKNIFTSSAAYMITEILCGLNRPDLPNNFESSLNLPKVAFKTGTSYGRRDAWSIGYSAEYTVGVWIGNVTHRGNPELTGSKAAAPLLIDIFNSISTTNQKKILAQPGDILIRDVCANSGLLPTPRCKHLIEDIYSLRRTLYKFCEIDKEFLVSIDNQKHFCTSCLSGNRYMLKTYQNFSPELVSYWNSIGKQHIAPPPHNPACARVFGGEGPKILSPSQDMTYFLVSANQKIVLHATSNLEVNEHIWYINDEYIGKDNVSNKRFVSLKNGEHTITCMDDKGRTSSVKIKIKYIM